MGLDDVYARVASLVREAGLEDQVTLIQKSLAGTERLEVTRVLGKAARYLRITPVSDPSRTWDFEILGGSYGNADPTSDFDGRGGGDSEYVAKAVQHWIINLGPWDDLPYERSE